MACSLPTKTPTLLPLPQQTPDMHPQPSFSSTNCNKRNHHQHNSFTNGRSEGTGFEDEHVLLLVFRSINFDPRVVSVTACVSRRLRAVARRVLWRELCVTRAPRIASALGGGARSSGSGSPGVCGWHVLAKLLFFCCGAGHNIPGHFAPTSRFSKTSGRSFLHRRCWGDLLYVSDPCEHPARGEHDVGLYRGIFCGFSRSKTRAFLIGRQVQLDARVRCPYCGARVWSMNAARLVPRSASRRLGSHEGSSEYFVCVNGHLHGNCLLAHLSDGGDGDSRDGYYDDDDDEVDEDGDVAF